MAGSNASLMAFRASVERIIETYIGEVQESWSRMQYALEEAKELHMTGQIQDQEMEGKSRG